MAKIIIQQNFHNYKEPIIEKDRYSLTINNPINKSTRFYNVLEVPGNPLVKRSKPIVPWRPLQGSLAEWKAKSCMGQVSKNLHTFRSNVPSEIQPVPDHRDADYTHKLNDYILNTLMPEVNQRGTPPFWLRALAAIAAWFGYHGVGQTNSPSCAASVAYTLKQQILHQAFPTLSSSPPMFTTLRNASTRGSVMQMDSIENLSFYLKSVGVDLNIVLTINRPHSFWRRLLSLFGSVNRHTCNIIKIDNDLHLVDTQKRRYHLVNLRTSNTSSMDLIPTLQDFIGAVAPQEQSLTLYDVGW